MQPIPAAASREAPDWVLEPYLHASSDGLYNPLTDRSLAAGEPRLGVLARLRGSPGAVTEIEEELLRQLVDEGWLVRRARGDLDNRFLLKYASLEATTPCNQACYFCPVAIDPRDDESMPMDLYEAIAGQLATFRPTLQAVSMSHYNEPTADPRFLQRLEVLHRHGLPAAVLTNGTGLTPDRIEAILELGGLRFLSVNLSTLDRGRYREDRRGDHLARVLRNLEALGDRRIAEEMVLVVLGQGDEIHRHDISEIRRRFADSAFEIKHYRVMNRTGLVPLGERPAQEHRRLRGCEQTGSRPLQWIHITAEAKCVLCCQDYHSRYEVGDLTRETVSEVLASPRFARLRRWAYGHEEAPGDFICRGCVYALTR